MPLGKLPYEREYIGILSKKDGELVWVRDGDLIQNDFDGPCLWPDLKTAVNDTDDVGGISEDFKFVKVSVTVSALE